MIRIGHVITVSIEFNRILLDYTVNAKLIILQGFAF